MSTPVLWICVMMDNTKAVLLVAYSLKIWSGWWSVSLLQKPGLK